MNTDIPTELLTEWLGLLSDPQRAQGFYFEHILPLVVQKLPEAPEHAEIRARGCSTLVSTMGFSPETTVITACVLRPRRLVIVSSRGNTHELDLTAEFLISQKILTYGEIRIEDVDPTNTEEIYAKIRRHFPSGKADETPIMDVTGGKKIMSATAAIAAWELRIPLCYVEGAYDAALRRPRPGSERIILLANPSQVQAAVLRERAIQWYEQGSMRAAIEAFRESKDAQTTRPQIDELALQLARCQSALMDLDFETLKKHAGELGEMAGKPRFKQLTAHTHLDRHVAALDRVATQDRIALLATFRHLATRYAQQGRFDFACLLIYRTLEDLVAIGLAAASRTHSFDPSSPDLSLLSDDVNDLEAGFSAIWKKMHPDEPTAIPAKITFLAGLTLLGIATGLRLASYPDLLRMLRHAAGQAAMRNHSILAHGTSNLRDKNVKQLRALERELARAILLERADELNQLEADLEPLAIRTLA